MKFFLSFSIFILLSACGGGSGGGSSSALNWTTTHNTNGPSSYYRNSRFLNQSGSRGMCNPSSQACGIGVQINAHASSDAFTFSTDQGYYESDFSPGHLFYTSDIESTSSVSSSRTPSLGTTNYTYSNYNSSTGYTKKVTIGIPTEYTNQYWVYWDNWHGSTSEYDTFSFGVIGLNQTSYASLPSSGSATYSGGAEIVYGQAATLGLADSYYLGGGNASFTANWSSKTIYGSISNVTLANSISSIGLGTLTMASTDIVSSSYNSYSSGQALAYFAGNLTGGGTLSDNNIHGYFFGSNYDEIGGTFNLDHGTYEGAGYFAAKK